MRNPVPMAGARQAAFAVASAVVAASVFAVFPNWAAREDDLTAPVQHEAPPLPKQGPLAQPRSRDQAGLPPTLTEYVMPAGSPITPDAVALGEKLFFDSRLSANDTVACATCHDPALAFTDGRPTSLGIHGRLGQRNAPTVLNALYNKT